MMDADRIQELLQQADEKAGEPTVAANLVGQTYRIRAHRRRVAVGLSTAVGLVIVAGLWYVNRGLDSNDVQPISQPEVARNQGNPSRPVDQDRLTQEEIEALRQELALLRAEAEMRTAMLAELLERQEQQEKLLALERQARQYPDPLEEVNRLVERAALITLYQADRKYNELDLKESAIADYRQVIDLYPQTHWAKQARKRLAEIQTKETPDKQCVFGKPEKN